jgi:ankyrin repeat protein
LVLKSISNRDSDVSRLLLEHGTYVSYAHGDKQILSDALFKAYEEGEYHIVRVLTELGVDVTALDSGGDTAAGIATTKGYSSIVTMLSHRKTLYSLRTI